MMRHFDEIRARVAAELGAEAEAVAGTSLCAFPQMPVPEVGYSLAKILAALGIAPQPYSPWRTYDVCIAFEDETFPLVDVRRYVEATKKTWQFNEDTEEWTNREPIVGRFLNGDCGDISKRRVAAVFAEVFGRSLDVDPRTFAGRMVRKSNANAAHDGKVVDGPLKPEECDESGRVVYNVHVDNVTDGIVTDFRLPWFGHLSPKLYRKQRPAASRFSDTPDAAVSYEPVSDHFSSEEIERISAFCRAFRLDYGEIDCLRDRDTGDIFIVDVNKTPAGLPNRLPKPAFIDAVCTHAVEFAKGCLG